MSQGAAGKLGGSLVFANSKGRSYIKKLTPPKQPRTANQIPIRLLIAFLSKRWATISNPDKATWLQLAEPKHIAAYHAYLGENTRRWRNFLGPSTAYPATLTGSHSQIANPLLTPITRGIRFSFNIVHTRNEWMVNLHNISGALADCHWNDLVGIIADLAPGSHYIDHQPLEPGTYWYRLTRVTAYGKGPTQSTWNQSAIVT